MDELVARLRERGLLEPDAARRADELESRAHLPLAREIHAFLYLGAVLILAGVGATVKGRLDELGPGVILAALGASAAACFAYCVRASRPFAPGKVESPAAAFDYILYLACGLVGVFFAYIGWRWRLDASWWDLYLFGSGTLFAALAYRFDNRLVLATGLLNLAAWLGARTGRWDLFQGATKPALVAYAAGLVALGFASRRGELKPHFADTYLTLGVHLGLMTLLPDSTRLGNPQFYVLMAACAALGFWSMNARRFDTFAAAVGYAFIAALGCALRETNGNESLWLIIISSGAVLAILLWARARFKEAAS